MEKKLELSVYGKIDSDIMLLVCIIGLLESLKSGVLAIDECEQYLFNPYSVELLEGKDIDKKTIDIVQLGTELEDIESLLPHRLDANIQDLLDRAKNLLREIKPEANYYTEKKWLTER